MCGALGMSFFCAMLCRLGIQGQSTSAAAAAAAQSPVNPLTFLFQMHSGITEPASTTAQQSLHSYTDRDAWDQPDPSGMPPLHTHNQLKMINSTPSAAASLKPGGCFEAEYDEVQGAATRAPVCKHVTKGPAPTGLSMPIATADSALSAGGSRLPRYVPAMPTVIQPAAAKPRGNEGRVCIVCWNKTPTWVCVSKTCAFNGVFFI